MRERGRNRERACAETVRTLGGEGGSAGSRGAVEARAEGGIPGQKAPFCAARRLQQPGPEMRLAGRRRKRRSHAQAAGTDGGGEAEQESLPARSNARACAPSGRRAGAAGEGAVPLGASTYCRRRVVCKEQRRGVRRRRHVDEHVDAVRRRRHFAADHQRQGALCGAVHVQRT